MDARRIRILVNPSAHSGRGVTAIARAGLKNAGPENTRIEWIESRSASHLRDLVAEAQRDEVDAIGLAGGDGTVAIAIGALDESNRIPFGLLPSGSGNDFAHDVGVPRSLEAAFDVLVRGVPRWVDVARAGAPGARYCCVAAVGLDEHALRIIHGSRFPRSKALNLYASLRALAVYRPRAVRVEWDNGSYEGEVMFAAVTNTRSYGGGFRLSPKARVDDGVLDLCIVGRTGRARLIGQFPRILEGTHDRMREVRMATSAWFRLTGLDGELPVTLDGELPSAETPIELRCEPRAVPVLAPREVVG